MSFGSLCNSIVLRSTLSTGMFGVTRCGTESSVHLNCATFDEVDNDQRIAL